MPMMRKNNKMVCVVCPAIKKKARKNAKKKRALRSSPPLDPPCQQPQQPLEQQQRIQPQPQPKPKQLYVGIPRQSKKPTEMEAADSLKEIGSIGACSRDVPSVASNEMKHHLYVDGSRDFNGYASQSASYQSQYQLHVSETEAREASSRDFPDVLSYDGKPTLTADNSHDNLGNAFSSESNQRSFGGILRRPIHRSDVDAGGTNGYRSSDIPDALPDSSNSYNTTYGCSRDYLEHATMSEDACRLYALEEGLYGDCERDNNTGRPSFSEQSVPRQSIHPTQQQEYRQTCYDDVWNETMACDNNHYWVQYSSSQEKSGPQTRFSFDDPRAQQQTSHQFHQNRHHPPYTDNHRESTHVHPFYNDLCVERSEFNQQHPIYENVRAPGENNTFYRSDIIDMDASFNPPPKHPVIHQHNSYESQHTFYSHSGDIRFLRYHHPHEAELDHSTTPEQHGSIQRAPMHKSYRAGEGGHVGVGRSNSFDIHQHHSYESHQSFRSRDGSVVSDTQCPRNLPSREMIWQHHMNTEEHLHELVYRVHSGVIQDRRYENDGIIPLDEKLNFERRPGGKNAAVRPVHSSGSHEQNFGQQGEQLDFDPRRDDPMQHEGCPWMQTSHLSQHPLIDRHEGEKFGTNYSEVQEKPDDRHVGRNPKGYPTDFPPSNHGDPIYPDHCEFSNEYNKDVQHRRDEGEKVDASATAKLHGKQNFDGDEENSLPPETSSELNEHCLTSYPRMGNDDDGRDDIQRQRAYEPDTSSTLPTSTVDFAKPSVNDFEQVEASTDLHEKATHHHSASPKRFLDNHADPRRGIDDDFTIEKFPLNNRSVIGNEEGNDPSSGKNHLMPRVEIDDVTIEVIKPNTPRSTKSQRTSVEDTPASPRVDDCNFRQKGSSLSDELNASSMNRPSAQNYRISPNTFHGDDAVPSKSSSHQRRTSSIRFTTEDKICDKTENQGSEFASHHPMTETENKDMISREINSRTVNSATPQFNDHGVILTGRQQQDSDEFTQYGTSLSSELNARSTNRRPRINLKFHDTKYERNDRGGSTHDGIAMFHENHNFGADNNFYDERDCTLPKTPKHRNGSKIDTFMPSPAQSSQQENEANFAVHDLSPSLSQSSNKPMRKDKIDSSLHGNHDHFSETKSGYNRTSNFRESSRKPEKGIMAGNRQHRPPLPTGRRANSSHHSQNHDSIIELSPTGSHTSVSRVNSENEVRSIDYTYENILPESSRSGHSPFSYEGTLRERSIERAPEHTKERIQVKTQTNPIHEQDDRKSLHHDLDIPSLEGDNSFDQKMVDLKSKLSSLKLQMSPASFHGQIHTAFHNVDRSEVTSCKFSFEERDDHDEAENRHVQPFAADHDEDHSSIRMQTDRSNDFCAPASKYIVLKNGFDSYSFLSDSELAERNRPDPTPTNGRTPLSGHFVNGRKHSENGSKCSVDPPGKRAKSSSRKKEKTRGNSCHRKEPSGYDHHHSKNKRSHLHRPDPLAGSKTEEPFDDKSSMYRSVSCSHDMSCETPTTKIKLPSTSQKQSQGSITDKHVEHQQQVPSQPKQEREPAPPKENDVELSIPSWVDEEMELPLKVVKSQDSMDELLQKIDEIENDFDTIVASLPSMTDDASFSATPSKSEDTRSTSIEMKSSSMQSKSQLGLDSTGSKSFESEEESVVKDMIGRMRRVQEYIDAMDVDNEEIESDGSYDSHGEMTDLIRRLANAAESLRTL